MTGNLRDSCSRTITSVESIILKNKCGSIKQSLLFHKVNVSQLV